MDPAQVCPECGSPLRHAASAGHCPGCLLRLALSIADGGVAFGLEESTAGRASTASELLRSRFVGDYELLEELGRGGMGAVYKARQVRLNRFVALKLIRAGDFADAHEVARFRAEAEAAATLDHPNIVPIYEVGEHDGRHYFSMKLIEGETLAKRIANLKSPLSDRAAASLLATVARAVHHAHQRGLLHRDLKPGNILVDRDGQPHITDFGLACGIETDSALTRAGTIVGTPNYIAPEQAAGVKALTTAADVYSLGAMLYELIAGRPPFVGATVMETLQQGMHDEPVAPWIARRTHRAQGNPKSEGRAPQEGQSPKAEHDAANMQMADSGIRPSDLDIICLKCLEKDPARRYGSAEALAEDLECWLGNRPIQARPATTVERLSKWVQRKPAWAAAIAALLLVTGLGLAGVLWQWRAAVAARLATQQELWHAQLLEARSFRLNAEPGRRANALEVISRAAAHRPSVDLRNEAMAVLVLPDLGSNLWWHSEPTSLWPNALSGDLKFIAHHAQDGTISILHHAGLRPLAQFRGLGAAATAMRFSPDDSLVAAKFANGAIGVWRWRERQLLLKIQSWPDNSDLPSYDFTPDGREFWISDAQEQIARFSLPDGQALAAPAIDRGVRRLRFDPTGRRWAGWSSNSIAAWDVGGGTVLGEWRAPGVIWCLDWHPRGDAFALGLYEKGVHLAEIGETNLFAFSADAAENAVYTSVGFSADGNYLAAGGWGNLFAVWSYGTRQQELRSRSHSFCRFSRDGVQVALAVEGRGYGVRTFESPIGIRRLRVPAAFGGYVQSAAWHPSGRWLLTGHPHGWALWNPANGHLLHRNESDAAVRSIEFVPDGSAFLTGGDAGAQLWTFSTEHEWPQVGPPRTLTSTRFVPHERAALSPDGRRFAAVGKFAWLGSIDGLRTPVSIADADGNDSVSFSPDGRWLLLRRFRGTHLKIRDAVTGGFVTNLDSGTPNGRFTPRGDHIVSISGNHVTYWEVGTWRKLRDVSIEKGSSVLWLADFWPDGSCAVVNGLDGAAHLWDFEARQEVAALRLPTESVFWGAVFAPTARQMTVTAGRPTVDLWDFDALRRELARLGLDWPGESPSTRFAPRR